MPYTVQLPALHADNTIVLKNLSRSVIALGSCLFILAIGTPASHAAGTPIDIVNGDAVSAEDYASTWGFIVALTRPNATGHSAQFCGGSLIDASTVITAAHCMTQTGIVDSGLSVDITAGRRDLNGGGGDVVAVESVHVHPSYNSGADDFQNDIAVLKLARPTTITSFISVIGAGQDIFWNGLDDLGDDAGATDPVLIAGWGNIGDDVRPPDGALRGVVTEAQSDALCAELDSPDDHGWGADFFSSSMICAGTIPGSGGTNLDACQGDSGGPLIADTDPSAGTSWRLVGLTSWGGSCGGDKWGVYSRLDALRGFAEGTHPALASATTSPQQSTTATSGSSVSCLPATWSTGSGTQTFGWERVLGDGTQYQNIGDGPTLLLTDSHAGTTIRCRSITRAATWTGLSRSGLITVAPRASPPSDSDGSSNDPQPDTTRPTAKLHRRSCTKKTCTLIVRASDSGGLTSVRAASIRSYSKRCSKRSKRMCKAIQRSSIRAVRVRPNAAFWRITIPRRTGRYKVLVTATDKAGLTSRPLTVRYRN